MKLVLRIAIAVVILSLICVTVQAQEEPTTTVTPRWVSDKGFWVVESNVNNREESTIYFYNNNKVQVYKEVVNGKQLKLKKRKTLMSLKKVLETAVLAFEQHRPVAETEKLFVAATK
jgi:hypothetical protein